MLVDYSDSDASDTEASPAPPPPPKPTSGLAALLPKPKGARKGDPADNGPKKIVVNLPNINDAALDQPPTKKARIGGGGSSLSAMLPAPKKRKEAEAAAATESKDNGDFAPVEVKKPRVLGAKSAGAREVGEVLMPSTDRETGEAASEAPQVLGTKGNSTMFVPQSVVGRKTIQPMSAFRKKSAKGAATGSIKVAGAAAPQPKAKVSLFGSTTTASAPLTYTGASTSTGEYKPIMLESVQPAPRPRDDVEDHDGYEEAPNVRYGTSEEPQRDELDALVSEVGLDEAAQRQLYGRRGRGKEPVNISTFSVDAEYRKNEVDKALGLVEEVKTVRAIQSGKHQLKSLLQSAQSQKDALEDQFAQAKRNKKEAGSKYGW